MQRHLFVCVKRTQNGRWALGFTQNNNHDHAQQARCTLTRMYPPSMLNVCRPLTAYPLNRAFAINHLRSLGARTDESGRGGSSLMPTSSKCTI